MSPTGSDGQERFKELHTVVHRTWRSRMHSGWLFFHDNNCSRRMDQADDAQHRICICSRAPIAT